MRQRREALRSADADADAYQRLNVLCKRAIKKDMRDDITERVHAAPASGLFKQLQSVIAPKRGPSVSPVNLTAS